MKTSRTNLAQHSQYAHLGNIEPIVEGDLCARCGACSICPYDAIIWDDQSYPRIVQDKCTDCGICMAVCPGADMDIHKLGDQVFGNDFDTTHPLGTVKKPYIAYAEKKSIRDAGAGGGIVTQLLIHLLDSGKIDGAIVVSEDPDKPWLSKPIIAQTPDEIKACAGSRYTVVPTLKALPELKQHKGKRFALVCLPCQVHGFRYVERVMPRLTERIELVIGLYCGTNWEVKATTALIKQLGCNLSDVTHIAYRSGEWPGNFQVKTYQGDVHVISKRVFNYLRFMYEPQRCTTCVDMSSEFSDLAIGDAWFRDENGSYPFANCSTVLARTPKGLDWFEAAIEEGAIGVIDAADDIFVAQHKPGINAKKKIAYQRTLTKRGPSPNYHMPIPRLKFPDNIGVLIFHWLYTIAHWGLVRIIATWFVTSSFGLKTIEWISKIRKKLKLDLV